MKLPPITGKQQELLRLLYVHRFLSRDHLQTLMNHKDRKTINLWLRDLRAKQYVSWRYSTDYGERTKPAVYYLGLNGIRWLRMIGGYPAQELNKRYRESQRSQSYVERCLLLADCYVGFRAQARNGTQYRLTTQVEYKQVNSSYTFLVESDLPSQLGPQLCVVKQKGGEETNYLLEVFDANLPSYRVRNRLKQYVEFLVEGGIPMARSGSPTVSLLVFWKTSGTTYAKRKVKQLLKDAGEDGRGTVRIRFTSAEQIRCYGVTAKIWEEC